MTTPGSDFTKAELMTELDLQIPADPPPPPPIPTIVSTSNSSTASGTTLIVDMPDNPTVGNTLVMIVGFWGGWTPTGLTGWTQRALAGGTAQRIACYTRVVDGTEAANYTVGGFAASNDPRAASVSEVNGVFDVAAAVNGNGPSSTPWAVPNVTTTASDLLLRACFSQSQVNTINWTWAGTPVSVANFYTAPGGGWYGHLSVVRQDQPTAGVTPATTVTRSTSAASDNFGALTVALKAA